jgi:hypothetical protein
VVHSEEASLLGVVLVPCCEDVIDHSCPSLIARWQQERMAQGKGQQVQNGDWDAKLFSCFELICGTR